MAADNGDDLALLQDVGVIHSTAPALRLRCRGDRGKLFIRVARDRNLIAARGTAIRSCAPSLLWLPAALHLVRRAK